MNELFGIFLLDGPEVLLRIYQASNGEWKLVHYFRSDLADEKLESAITAHDFVEVITDFLSKNVNNNIAEWKFSSRALPDKTINDIAEAIGFPVERLQKDREQELLSKGMFT